MCCHSPRSYRLAWSASRPQRGGSPSRANGFVVCVEGCPDVQQGGGRGWTTRSRRKLGRPEMGRARLTPCPTARCRMQHIFANGDLLRAQLDADWAARCFPAGGSPRWHGRTTSRWVPSEKETEKERVRDDNRDRAGRSGLSANLDLEREGH